MPFITLLDTNTDQVHILNTLQDQIYSTSDSTQLRPQRCVIDRLTGICLPDCPSQSISTLPATTFVLMQMHLKSSLFPFSLWRITQIQGVIPAWWESLPP